MHLTVTCRLDITLTHKPFCACHVDVLKMGPPQDPVVKMADVPARMGLPVKNVTGVLLATGD